MAIPCFLFVCGGRGCRGTCTCMTTVARYLRPTRRATSTSSQVGHQSSPHGANWTESAPARRLPPCARRAHLMDVTAWMASLNCAQRAHTEHTNSVQRAHKDRVQRAYQRAYTSAHTTRVQRAYTSVYTERTRERVSAHRQTRKTPAGAVVVVVGDICAYS